MKQILKSQVIIGNDIIEWQNAKKQLHKLKPRCLEKLFNTSEINYINNHEFPILAFWHLWSVKESAYKAWQRLENAKPIFNPYAFCCQDIQSHSVRVVNGDFSCRVETVFNSAYIYSQCQSKSLNFKILKSNIEFLNLKNQWKKQGWHIQKNSYNIPSLFHNKHNIQKPISISHDNGFTAVCWFDD